MSNKINNTDEYLDLGFGTEGKASMMFPDGSLAIPTGITVTRKGALLIACSVNSQFGLVCLTHEGKPEESFATKGFFIGEFALGYRSRGTSVSELENDQILLVGTAEIMADDLQQTATALALFEPNGALAKQFGKDGKALYAPLAWPGQTTTKTQGSQNVSASTDQQVSAVELPDGKFLVTGNHRGADHVGLLMRVDEKGGLDKAFGNGKGYERIQFLANKTQVDSLIRLKDGTFVIGGTTRIEDKIHIMIVHLDKEGVPINAFGSDGYAVFNVSSNDQVVQIMETPDGKILALLNVHFTGEMQTTALICLDTDGNFADDFNQGQLLVIPTPNGNMPTGGVCLDDGAIVVVGSTLGSDTQIYITKREKNGTPVPEFGNNGMLLINLGDSIDVAHSMDIQQNQVVLGTVSFPDSNNKHGSNIVRCSKPI